MTPGAAIDDMPWLQATRERVALMLASGRLPHALCIEGPAGLGKTALAEHLAAWLLCGQAGEDGPCGHCADCQLLAAGQHPDRILLLPDSDSGRFITVHAIRQLSERLSLRPQRQGRQVALLVPADAMNEAAANALLKTLEEPSPDAHLLLLCHHPAALPQTILSRCVRLRVTPPSETQLRAWLTPRCPPGLDVELLLQWCGGMPLRVVDLLQGEGAAEWQRVHQALEDCLAGRSTAMATALALVRSPDLALTLLERKLERIAARALSPAEGNSVLTSMHGQSTLAQAWQACRSASALLGSGLRDDLALAHVLQRCREAVGGAARGRATRSDTA